MMLLEVAKLYKQLVKERLTYSSLADPRCPTSTNCAATRYSELSVVVFRLLRSDPLGAYVELKRILRRESIKGETLTGAYLICHNKYLEYLSRTIQFLEGTKLIQIARPYLPGFQPGDRTLYRKIFAPVIKPDFMYTKLLSAYPAGGIELASYQFRVERSHDILSARERADPIPSDASRVPPKRREIRTARQGETGACRAQAHKGGIHRP